MLYRFSGTELLLGKDAMEKLASPRAAAFGGVGAFDLVDDDRICLTNLNRQIIAANKLDAFAFRVEDIFKTRMAPLARVMRRELKKRGIKGRKVVYSQEQPIRSVDGMAIGCRAQCICPLGTKRHCTDIPGSTAFVPSVAGPILAGEVIRDLAWGRKP